jgi:chloramphenicol 3-O phosphotransferase
VLEQREQGRSDRTLGQARLQFQRVHAHGLYDIEVNTALLTPMESALAVQAKMTVLKSPTALNRLYRRMLPNSSFQNG